MYVKYVKCLLKLYISSGMSWGSLSLSCSTELDPSVSSVFHKTKTTLTLYYTSPHTAHMSSPLSKPQVISHIQKSLNYTVFDSKWIPCSAKFVCMGSFPRGTGVMQIYEVQQGEARLLREVTCHNMAQQGTTWDNMSHFTLLYSGCLTNTSC